MLDKAIISGKERRKQYVGAKSVDSTCRNHGGCSYCEGNRTHKNAKKIQSAIQKEQELNDNFGDYTTLGDANNVEEHTNLKDTRNYEGCMKLINFRKIKIEGSNSTVSLKYPTEGWGKRFFCIEGNEAYFLGYPCGSCNFLFERLEGAKSKVSPNNIIESLATKKLTLDDNEFDEICSIIPDGNYVALQLEMTPKLIKLGSNNDYFVSVEGIDPFWGLHHNPKVKYYMNDDMKISNIDTLHSFLLPIVPDNWLEGKMVDKYKSLIGNGVQPTAIALSYLDIMERDENVHTCFVNILLDGHHKIFATSTLKNTKPINVLSFLSLDMGVSTEVYINEYLNKLMKLRDNTR